MSIIPSFSSSFKMSLDIEFGLYKHELAPDKPLDLDAELGQLQKPQTITRSYPSLSVCDTVKRKHSSGKGAQDFVSIHGSGAQVLSFQDHEIILPVLASAKKPPEVTKTAEGKAVIQQQALRGCTEACVAMLAADHGKKINWESLLFCTLFNIRDDETVTVLRSFENYGLRAKTYKIHSLEDLRRAIQMQGPGIVHVESGCGVHAVIVDSIAEDLTSAVIRDPFHGWQIRISGEALAKASRMSTKITQVIK